MEIQVLQVQRALVAELPVLRVLKDLQVLKEL
jgi:hypothetical protein